MFTPPAGFDASASTSTFNSRNPEHIKQRTGRRYLWAVILIPLIMFTFPVSASFSQSRHTFVTDQSKWKREPQPQATVSSSSVSLSILQTLSASATSSTVPAASQALPTIPSSPPTLPTPFPQAFDGTFTQNFSSVSCLNFFNNITASTDFRECRPFSFLFSTSSVFINSNLTLMNSLIWGTCNTTIPDSQCQANMASFASSLQTDCSEELKNQNSMVVDSLTSLRAFQVMHDSACLADPTTNAYCYLSAVQNTNPSDFDFFSLPLGIPLPKTATPTCSECSKNLMGMYASALQDPSQAALLTGLKSTYQVSAQIAVQLCGAAFAVTSISAAISLSCGWPTIFSGFIFPLTWMVLAHVA